MSEEVPPSRLSISWKLLFFTGALNIIFGVDFLLSGSVFASYFVISPERILFSVRHGATLIGLGVLTSAISWKSYRQGERWAWFALLIAGLVVNSEQMVVNLIIGGSLVGVLIFLIFALAIYLPAREILRKSGKKTVTS